jgi:hypothetical protein
VTDASWSAIQALRAAPTGMADRDRQRRRIFTAALIQAEELAVAASAVTYAVRPLVLFYSLSQAGRAIAAAHLKAKAELSGHGLSFTCDPIAILKSTVVPPGAPGARGAFQDVATATGSLGLENPPNSVHFGPVTLTCSMYPSPRVVVSGRASCRAI